DFSDEIRVQAARALGSLRARDQVALLAGALEDAQNREHRGVRVEIVRSLGLIRDPAAGPALERTLRDPDKDVVEQAVLSLGLVGYKSARTALEELFRTDANRQIKSRALTALALMRDPASTPLFESLLSDKDDYHRELGAEGLARLNYDATGWKN